MENYILINFTKREYIDTLNIGETLDFGEFITSGNSGRIGLALAHLIADVPFGCMGTWAMDKIAIRSGEEPASDFLAEKDIQRWIAKHSVQYAELQEIGVNVVPLSCIIHTDFAEISEKVLVDWIKVQSLPAFNDLHRYTLDNAFVKRFMELAKRFGKESFANVILTRDKKIKP